jgi:hypothetical protein
MEVRRRLVLKLAQSIANTPIFVQRGKAALGGQEEDIPSHRFAPDTRARTICFKGERLSILNKDTNDLKTSVEDVEDYTEYEVPAGYSCYVIGGRVYFKA